MRSENTNFTSLQIITLLINRFYNHYYFIPGPVEHAIILLDFIADEWFIL